MKELLLKEKRKLLSAWNAKKIFQERNEGIAMIKIKIPYAIGTELFRVVGDEELDKSNIYSIDPVTFIGVLKQDEQLKYILEASDSDISYVEKDDFFDNVFCDCEAAFHRASNLTRKELLKC